MRPTTLLPILLSFFSAGTMEAQFPLVNSAPGSISTIASLTEGVRFIDTYFPLTTTAGTRIIYNLDMTPYRVLNYPAPPSGMWWANMSYITETLFDTDPSTIEYTMTAMPADGDPGNFAAFVFRDDGTQLFVQDPGSITGGSNGLMATNEPIFTTDEGTFMVVHTMMVNGGPANVYQLPGTLPCFDCYGTPHQSEIGLGVAGQSDRSAALSLRPNPAQSEVHVVLGEAAAGADQVTVVDAAGREVLHKRVQATSTLTLDIAKLANGQYTVLALSSATLKGSVALVIAR